MWSVYPAGQIDAFCICYVRLDFQYICDVIILLFIIAECRIGKRLITMTTHTRHRISTHWQLHCLLNSSFRQTWKKTSSRPFVRGICRRGNGQTLEHRSSTPVIPCDGNPLVTSGFTAHRASNVIIRKLHNSGIIRLSCVFDSLASQMFVQQLVWTNMKEDIAFVRRNHREQMETFNTGTALRKPLITWDVIKWKHFPRYWPFVRGIHRSPVNYPHKSQWRGALMFSLMCTRINVE